MQEDPIDGAQDGVWQGIRYFSCRQGHGFFCPVSSLTPDARFTPNTSAGSTVNRELLLVNARRRMRMSVTVLTLCVSHLLLSKYILQNEHTSWLLARFS